MKRSRLAQFASVSLGIAAVLVLPSCQEKAPAEAGEAEVHAAQSVEVQQVAASSAIHAIEASGLTSFKREAAVSFGTSGEIQSVHFDVGDKVSGGALLASLRRISAGADRNESELAEQTAQQTYDRVQRLNESGAASDTDLEAARLALERARTRVEIRAPRASVVLRRDAERGQVVSAGQPVFWLGEAGSGVIVRANVTASEARRTKAGDRTHIQIRDRGEFVGSVARISPVSAGAAGVFEIEIQIDETGELRSGEIANVQIEASSGGLDQTAPTIIIPALALVDARADQGVVFIVDETGAARRRSIETAGVSSEGVIVTSGLLPGDRVITRGASMLRDGVTVQVINE